MTILFLQKRPLFPADSGGKIRTLNIVRYLARWHEVTYLCNAPSGDEAHAGKMRELGVRFETIPWRETARGTGRFFMELAINLASRYPYNVNKDFDRRLRRRARDLVARHEPDLVICDFVQMARNALGIGDRPTLLFQHNVEAELFRRQAACQPGWARRLYLREQWRKMRRFEASAGRRFDAVVAVSERDKAQFERDYGWAHVQSIDTAVDLDYFVPAEAAEVPDTIVFVGSMDWLANVDAVEDFVTRSWPLIRSARPAARLRIVGRNPIDRATRLARVDGVEVVGTVPDVRPYLGEAAVMVVPLRIAGGTRLKIFEAMAMRKAVVSTSIGAEGLPVQSGHDIVVADGPVPFAHAVIDLLADPARRETLGRCARELAQGYSAERVAR